MHKSHVPPTVLTAPSASISTPGIEIKVEPQLQTLMETPQEEDSVFNDQPTVKPDPDQKRLLDAERRRSLSIRGVSKETNGLTGGAQKGREKPREEEVYFSWCNHHHSLLMVLSSIIQTVAVHCPTAFVHCRVKSSGRETSE